MKIKVNDAVHDIAEGTSLAAFIEDMGLTPPGIAVAINFEVVPKELWARTVLADGAEVILIHAASGG